MKVISRPYDMIALSLAAICSGAAGGAAHDNFLIAFDRDIHSFGFRRSQRPPRKAVDKKEIKEVKTEKNDEFEMAQDEIFHAVENVEKKILDVARDLIDDEVDTLFGEKNFKKNGENLKCNRKIDNAKKVNGKNSERKGKIEDYDGSTVAGMMDSITSSFPYGI